MTRAKTVPVKVQRRSAIEPPTKDVIVPVSTWRYNSIVIIFGILFVGLGARAVQLQIIDNDYLQSQGDARYLRVQKEPPTRGMITDRNGQPIAVSTPVDSIWMQPATILRQKQEYSYKELSKLLEISPKELLAKAEKRKGREFVYLKRHLPPQLANKILALNVPGINKVREYKRYYPTGPVMGHVLGFTNIDNEGQEGLELAYDDKLKGQAGRTQVLRDKVGHVVEYVEQLARVRHGDDIVLSLDTRIQYLAYRHLQAAVKKHNATSASLVALDAKTGEVLSMISMPDFNPNDRGDLKSAHFRNRSITDSYEPGSTVKPITVAMAMEEGVVDASTMIDTEKGFYYIGRSRISDTKPYGEITVSDVIKKSSNIGSAKIAMMLDPNDLYHTYRDLGFGRTNKLKIQGEQKGMLANRKKPIEHATMSYGYGEVADQIALMLELAVSDSGTAPKARVDQYRVGGKTGTAHRVVDGRYQDDILVVSVNDPKGVDYYGGLVAAPVFSEVMAGALRLRGVAPDAMTAPKEEPGLKLMISRPIAGLESSNQKSGEQ